MTIERIGVNDLQTEVSVSVLYLIIGTLLVLLLASGGFLFIRYKITEFQKLLKASADEFQSIFEHPSVGICTTSLDGKFLNANKRFCDILGYSLNELFSMPCVDLYFPDFQIDRKEGAKKLLDNKSAYVFFEKQYVQKNGHTVWLGITAYLHKYPNIPVCFVTTIQDITSTKQYESDLSISENRLKGAQAIAHIGNWELTVSDQKLWASEEAFKIYGINRENSILPLALVQKTVNDADRPKLDHALRLLVEKNEKYDVNFRIIRASDGDERYVHSRAILEFDINGRPEKVVGTIHDITEIMQAEEIIVQAKEKYEMLANEFRKKQSLLISLINSVPDLIFYKDIDGVYLGCNRAFELFAGKAENELVGLTDFNIFDKNVAEQFREADIKMMEERLTHIFEETVSYPDGRQVVLETLKTPYYETESKVIGLIGISRDVTERKRKEEEINYLNCHDTLTGLYNRSFFDQEKKRLDTENQFPLSAIIGDINGLKLINDTLGFEEGDRLIFKIARLIKSCCRPQDIVARTGGNEFSILLPQTTTETAVSIMDHIMKTCEGNISSLENETYYTNISLGHAAKISEGESIDGVIRNAEDLMYKRKLLARKSMHSTIIASMKATMFEKNQGTEEHAERLVKLTRLVGKKLGLNEDKQGELELLSTLHDIGKIGISDSIINKPGKLTKEEWVQMKKHPEIGYRIATSTKELSSIADYIRCHHEHWDGKGYPLGLKGEEIPLLSRILSVVDSYDAMTQDRPYRKAMSKEMAIAEIRDNAGTQFDPEIAELFLDIIKDYDH